MTTAADYRRQYAEAMPEADLLDAVQKLAGALGWLYYHPYDSRRSVPGYPDLTLVHPQRGRVVFAELKTQRGRPTPPQCEWLRALDTVDDTGKVSVHLWRPVDLIEGAIERVLKA